MIADPFSITYGSRLVGGSSEDYRLHGPHVIERGYETFRLVFDVVVVAESYDDLQALSDALEDDFRKRDQNVVISLDGATWTYTSGTTVLNTRSTITKSGDPLTDRGFSRAYTVSIEGDLPAEESSNNGLREMSVNVIYEAGQQKVVTMSGAYTAVAGPPAQLASVQYLDATNGFAPNAATILTAIDGSATFERVAREFSRDRNDHTCQFREQYVQLLADQSLSGTDDSTIRDHKLVFTDTSQHPGDSGPGVFRFRRVIATYDCAVDIGQTTDLQAVYNNTVHPYIVSRFRSTFIPTTFAVEDKRVSYDETTKRLSVSLQLIYQAAGGSAVVETSESVAYRESRTIDYTPVHDGDQLAMYADPGWATVERVKSRTTIFLGALQPKSRIKDNPAVASNGWNLVQNTSQSRVDWIGDPEVEDQIQVTVLTETEVERFHQRPRR